MAFLYRCSACRNDVTSELLLARLDDKCCPSCGVRLNNAREIKIELRIKHGLTWGFLAGGLVSITTHAAFYGVHTLSTGWLQRIGERGESLLWNYPGGWIVGLICSLAIAAVAIFRP